MSVVIKGMDFPPYCGECKMHYLGYPNYVCCSITDRIPKIVGAYNNSKTDLIARRLSIMAVDRPDWCPLGPFPTPQWINVEDRMPEEPFGCLLIVEDCEPFTGKEFLSYLPYFAGWDGEQWNDADGERVPFEVLYWMPLPKIPEVRE